MVLSARTSNPTYANPETVTATGIISQFDYLSIGVLTENITLTIEPGVTRFKIRDKDGNIGNPFTVTLVLVASVDELILAQKRDYVEVDLLNGVWHYYNFRDGVGSKV